MDDPVCESLRELSGERGDCAAELITDVGSPQLASETELAGVANLVSDDGRRLGDVVAQGGTVYYKTWSATMRGIYYYNWQEKHKGKFYYDGEDVWQYTSSGHICGLGSGIGYTIKVTNCLEEVRYDLSAPAISNWDYFQVHVVWEGSPLHVSKEMHTNVYADGRVYFYPND